MWTGNFQTFKLDLEKAKEPEVKLPTSTESLKKQESSRKTSISALLITPKPKAETPVFWPPHAKSWLIGKDSDAGRDWGQERKRTTEDEMAGWHHWLDGRESEWTPGDGDGRGGLACCDSWGYKESDATEWLDWNELNWTEKLGWVVVWFSTQVADSFKPEILISQYLW